ncbi:hypothetical protein NITMOv2_0307 [Nitrospira moscoviensis]|uniref:Uncharacterized protein n=1 Tax=Nitrospira moscoviensis TaxID=42253 RepID=A0A0K2G734_NITMO|nr:hypothetical protein NITMOv2_0307 [Nitrospira moscoviensis]
MCQRSETGPHSEHPFTCFDAAKILPALLGPRARQWRENREKRCRESYHHPGPYLYVH